MIHESFGIYVFMDGLVIMIERWRIQMFALLLISAVVSVETCSFHRFSSEF